MRAVLNDAISIYFPDASLARAFFARWCAGFKAETAGGVFQVRGDDPVPRVGAALHRIFSTHSVHITLPAIQHLPLRMLRSLRTSSGPPNHSALPFMIT
jgi:hypothetical protein